jgi:hypothetical protein
MSDLHFGPYLQQTERIGEWSGFAAPHHYRLLIGMDGVIKKISRRFRDRLFVVVTGDLTTAAEPPAYMAVNNYLRDYPFVSSSLRMGLDLSKDLNERVLFVPGNHDGWIYGKWLTKWKKRSDRREEYKKYFPEQLPNIYPYIINSVPVAFYTLDSNQVTSFLNPCNFTNVLGKGEVGQDQMATLQVIENKMDELELPKGYHYGTSLKIALMHHHLGLPEDVPRDLSQKMLELHDSHAVKNLFLSLGIRLVLCGHQHFPYQLPHITTPEQPGRSLFLSCAGSATQMGCDQNSFYVYQLYKNGPKQYHLDSVLYTADAKNDDYIFREHDPVRFEIV